MDKLRYTWLEINLQAISNNLQNIKKRLPAQTLLMAVVKANAYGHGSIPVSQTAIAAGANYLGVATLGEALNIREAGITTPILVLSAVSPEYYEIAIRHNIELTLYDVDNATVLSKQAVFLDKTAQIHVKVDTGMGRIGLSADEEGLTTVKAMHQLPKVNIKGVFTHFATTDAADKSFAMEQFTAFKNFVGSMKKNGINDFIAHCANSAAIMDLPETYMDMVRAGIIIYGLYPSNEVQKAGLPLQPAMTLKTKIVHVKKLAKGKSVSYGRCYFCPEEKTIITVPIGYADGYHRALSNKARGVLKGKLIYQVGTVCMDQTMFDASEVSEITVGDVVTLFGDEGGLVTIDDMATWLNTINYEVVCMMGERIQRTYK